MKRRTFALNMLAAGMSPMILPVTSAFAEGSDMSDDGKRKTDLRVILEEKDVGRFSIDVNRFENRLQADIEVDISVRAILGLPVYSYQLSVSEEWRDGKLHLLKSQSRSGGKRRSVKADRESGSLFVDGTNYSGEAPDNAGTTSYFSTDFLDRKTWISTDGGELLDVSTERTKRVRITDQEFNVYRVSGGLEIDLFYTDDDRWGGALFEIEGRMAKILPGKIGTFDGKLA